MKIINILKHIANITLNQVKGYQTTYLGTAGTTTFTLSSGYSYLIAIIRGNTSAASYQGLYMTTVHANASPLTTIAETTAATLSMSGVTLSVTTTINYVRIAVIPLFNYPF